MAVYFYSIVWRQCLETFLNSGTLIIGEAFEDTLRQFILKEIYKPIMEIEKSTEFEQYPGIAVLTTYHRSDQSGQFINPNPLRTNPYLFFIGPYYCLLYHQKETSRDFKEKTGLPIAPMDKELIVNTAVQSRIGLISEEAWDSTTEKMALHEATRFINECAIKLSAHKRIALVAAHRMLYLKMTAIHLLNPDLYSFTCYQMALDQLLVI